MSAENAWRIAMEAAADLVAHTQEETSLRTGRRYLGKRAEGSLTGTAYAEGVLSLPMPPAFRAEVEAEAEELRGMLAEASAFLLLAQWPSAHEGARAHDLVSRIDALLSRLEAKGESHE